VTTEARATLRRLAWAITDAGRAPASLVRQSVELRELLERCAPLRPAEESDLGANQTRTAGGLAISPIKAALCAREPFRTICFIKGLAAAIAAARQPGRPVRVLYAGCGPFATLALPLMTLLDSTQAVFTLVDIHPESLVCARQMVGQLGLDASVAGFVLADATTLRLDPQALPDVIVSETMNAALRSEPQVAIFRHLAAQAPHALLVPQSVTVEACLLRMGKELPPPLDGPDAAPQPPQRERIALGRIFTLDAAAIRSWAALPGPLLPAAAIEVPAEVPDGMQARLLTRIVTFGPHGLDDYESSLNLPQRLPGKLVLAGGEHLQFAYRLAGNPGLVLA
jgi:hypothetical protein